jgi:hypothetical protein
VTRAVLSVLLCVATLAVGVVTVCLSARNRARSGDLDRRQHECETLLRQNQLERARIARDEWLLLDPVVALQPDADRTTPAFALED